MSALVVTSNDVREGFQDVAALRETLARHTRQLGAGDSEVLKIATDLFVAEADLEAIRTAYVARLVRSFGE